MSRSCAKRNRREISSGQRRTRRRLVELVGIWSGKQVEGEGNSLFKNLRLRRLGEEQLIPTLILTVDLECRLCSKKIKKAICKLQDRERIQKIEYDEKKNTVTISGPFDPVKLKNKLCCKACEVIQNQHNRVEAATRRPTAPTPPRKPEPVYLPFWPVGHPYRFRLPSPTVLCGVNDICRSCTAGVEGWALLTASRRKPVTYQFSLIVKSSCSSACSVM
ncbi:hypothetical protein KFK09_004610 [Dendrobium nobile]|uniref:HMA domain-containing protein n=1 Tax=Dendrobium nobile TaxID=94219 RepID=A0A8T3C677_DENNO|nr:hypothetical protein KFK09_004610 [Dendrobium nobile]